MCFSNIRHFYDPCVLFNSEPVLTQKHASRNGTYASGKNPLKKSILLGEKKKKGAKKSPKKKTTFLNRL